MSPSLGDAGTFKTMMRWLPRILMLVTLTGLLAMHGVDAAAASDGDAGRQQVVEATHAAQSVSHHADEPTANEAGASLGMSGRADGGGGGERGLHHVAAACMVALVAVVVAGARRYLLRAASIGTAVLHGVASAVVRATDLLLPPPEPGWLRLCVIRR